MEAIRSDWRTIWTEWKGRLEEANSSDLVAEIGYYQQQLAELLPLFVHMYRNEPGGQGAEDMPLSPREILECPEGKDYADETAAYSWRQLCMWASDGNYDEFHITDLLYMQPRVTQQRDGYLMNMSRELSLNFTVSDRQICGMSVTRIVTQEKAEWLGNKIHHQVTVLTGKEKARILSQMLENLTAISQVPSS